MGSPVVTAVASPCGSVVNGAKIPAIDVTAANAAATVGAAILLDVREDEEWRFGHAPDALHIPMGSLVARVGELDGSKQIICVCRSGNRSSQVTAWLVQQGFDAVNMTGGMNAWSSFQLPLLRYDGRPGTVI